MERLALWLLTETGKKVVYYAATATCIGAISLKAVPNTLLLDQYKNLFQFYRFGDPVPLSKKLQARFEKAIELAKVEEIDRHLLKPFHVIGFDTFHAGTTFSKFGAIIGIPINFTYESVDAIDKSEILIDGEAVAWGTPEADRFLNSIVLSEKAQLYAIAREIKTVNSTKFLLDTSYVGIPIIMYYGCTSQLNMSLNLFSKARGLRIIIYTLFGAFQAGIYFLFKDFTQIYFERKIDKELKEASPILAEGGKEFYSKLMSRNIALRTLLGKRGKSYFTSMGNEHSFIRQKHLPLSDRKLFFEQSLNE